MIKLWNPLLDSTCSWCFCGRNFFNSLAGFDRNNSSILSSHLIPQGIGEQLAKNQLFFHFSNPIPCRTMPFDWCLLQLLCLWHRPFLRSSFMFVKWLQMKSGVEYLFRWDWTGQGEWLHVWNLWDGFCKHIAKELQSPKLKYWNKIDSSKGQSSSVWWFPAKALRGMLTLLHTCS